MMCYVQLVLEKFERIDMYKCRSFPVVRYFSLYLILLGMSCFFSIDSFAAESVAPAAATKTAPAATAKPAPSPASSVAPTAAASAEPRAKNVNPITPAPKDFNPLLFDADQQMGSHKKKYYKSCSIYIYVRTFFTVRIINMSTYKVSSCPATEFGRVTAASVIAQLRTIVPITLVSLVGPYFQMMDENNSVIESAYISLGSLNFSPVMNAEISVFDIFSTGFNQLKRWASGETNYNPIPTIRNANYIWYRGSTIYRLLDPEGNQYVMVSFAPLDIDTISSEEEVTLRLNQLTNVLKLPAGWSFERKVLKRILTYTQIPFEGSTGAVVMDDLSNIYIKINDDLN
jgi:hypothetical protein